MAEAVEPAHLMAILNETVAGLDACVQKLATTFPLPRRVIVHGLRTFRHHDQDDLLLSFLKLIKIASHNNAAIVLLSEGYVQEVYALCRMIDEAIEDIHFMATPLGEDGTPGRHQIAFIEEFFQEEFSGTDPVKSHQSRDRVTREKVRAGISRIGGKTKERNPSLEVEIGRVLSGTFSGYVHGAYVHIMDLFGGEAPHFHTRGMLGTPRMQECLGSHVNYVYRSLLAVEGVGYRAFREDVAHGALDL